MYKTKRKKVNFALRNIDLLLQFAFFEKYRLTRKTDYVN